MKHQISFKRVLLRVSLSTLAALASLAVNAPARADDGPPRDEGRDDRDDEHHRGNTHIAVDFDFSSAVDTLGTTRGDGSALKFLTLGAQAALVL